MPNEKNSRALLQKTMPLVTLEPWQDESGETYSTERLTEESKKWDAITWERYLTTLEHSQTEGLVSNYDKLLDYASNVFDDDELPLKMAIPLEELHEAIGKLTGNQQRIIRMHLWEEKSFEEIGQELGRAKPVVWRAYQRAIGMLRKRLNSRCNSSRPLGRPLNETTRP